MAIKSKNATTLILWLQDRISKYLDRTVETFAHGGTALTLLGIKESTKDVDFSFTDRNDFDTVARTLTKMGYNMTIDSQHGQRSRFVRLEKVSEDGDVIDLHWPYWNNWRITELVLENSTQNTYGKFLLHLLDKNAIFLFKTYPTRASDIDDLSSIIDKNHLDQDRLISLLDEQDKMNRRALSVDTSDYDPLRTIIELRMRTSISLHLLGRSYYEKVKFFGAFADGIFSDLRLGVSRTRIAEFLHSDISASSSILDLIGPEKEEKLRSALIM